MRLTSTFRAGVVALAVVAAAVPATATVAAATPAPQGAHASHPPTHQPTDAAHIAALVHSMTLDEKVGQLFVTYAYGDTATTTDPQYTKQNQQRYGVDNGAQLVGTYHLGGVIYFTWANGLTDPTTIAQLSNGLQTASTSQPDGVPLLISVDQEGGIVSRLTAPVAISPGNMALGATFDPLSAYRTSAATAQQLKALGINLDDAPVVDTNTNPNNTADGARSFGDKALLTAAFGAGSVLGYQQSGVVGATAKHFPGLGSTSVNTDNGIAVSDQTKQQFYANDIPAFRAAIAVGTDEIMAAHIVAPALDPTGTPASLSKPMVTGILRNQLHYNGVVVTDSLGAAALANYADPQRSVLAVQAGDDELLMPTDLRASIAAVTAAVTSGQISNARLEQSVTRILQLKSKLGLFRSSQVDAGKAAGAVGTSGQNTAMDAAADRSITLLRNSAKVLPLAPNSGKKVLVTGWGSAGTNAMTAQVASHGVTATRLYTGGAPSQALIDAAVAAARQNDATIVLSYNSWGDPGQIALINALQATGKPIVVLATGAPYELGQLPTVTTFVAAYGYQTTSLRAAANVLFGTQPRGHLPVTVKAADGSVAAAFGTGLSYRR